MFQLWLAFNLCPVQRVSGFYWVLCFIIFLFFFMWTLLSNRCVWFWLASLLSTNYKNTNSVVRDLHLQASNVIRYFIIIGRIDKFFFGWLQSGESNGFFGWVPGCLNPPFHYYVVDICRVQTIVFVRYGQKCQPRVPTRVCCHLVIGLWTHYLQAANRLLFHMRSKSVY